MNGLVEAAEKKGELTIQIRRFRVGKKISIVFMQRWVYAHPRAFDVVLETNSFLLHAQSSFVNSHVPHVFFFLYCRHSKTNACDAMASLEDFQRKGNNTMDWLGHG